MVWFQCESCGENLKKPKLQNHFRGCAARKLSCIDCGVVFDQQSVQAHTSCVTETEKYGPKGVNKASNGPAQKLKSAQLPNSADIDLRVGLSTHPPWACSLCNVGATSYETLEGHSQGKKHRSKAKAAQAKLNPSPVVELIVPESNGKANGAVSVNAAEAKDDPVQSESRVAKHEKNGKKRKEGLAETDISIDQANGVKDSFELDKKSTKKKRKSQVDSSKNGSALLEEMNTTPGKVEEDLVNNGGKKERRDKKRKSIGEDLVAVAEGEPTVSISLPPAGKGEDIQDGDTAKRIPQPMKAVKWKKLIAKVLAQAPEGEMKTKKLVKKVLLMVVEKGADVSDSKIMETQLLEQLNICSKFQVDKKVVRLAKSS